MDIFDLDKHFFEFYYVFVRFNVDLYVYLAKCTFCNLFSKLPNNKSTKSFGCSLSAAYDQSSFNMCNDMKNHIPNDLS